MPDHVLTNKDFEKIVDTTDEWIRQRTGIRERRVCDPLKEGTFTLSRDAMARALEASKLKAKDLDLLICATCTSEMGCPSTACRIAGELGAAPAAAFDLTAACSGFVYSLNVAESIIRTGRARTVGIVGCDAMSTHVDYNERGVSILFGDAAGAAGRGVARGVAGLLRYLDLTPVLMIGHSAGAAIAIRMCLDGATAPIVFAGNFFLGIPLWKSCATLSSINKKPFLPPRDKCCRCGLEKQIMP